MFDKSRYLTRGVQAEIPFELQLVMWSCIDKLPDPKDYLQVFRLSVSDDMQIVTHEQEEPEYSKEYHQVRFSWDKVEGADRYGIAVYLAGKWRVQAQNITGTVYTSPKNLTPGKTYKVAIAARVNGRWDTANAIKHSGTVTIR